MKKFLVCLVILGAVLGIAFAFSGGEKGEYLRVHIRADSNDPAAQAVKYEVKDAVVALLTPTVATCETKNEAMDAIRGMLPQIEKTAEAVLSQKGYSYGARATLRRENFPTRVYDGVTLDAGVYDALIVELGSGQGDNWWCVVYPPLCFSGSGNVVYRSMIAEIIKKFFAKSA